MALYREGLQQPLHFFPKSAWVYVTNDGDLGKAKAKWSNWNNPAFGESRDPAYRLPPPAPPPAGLPYGLELIEDAAELRHEAVADFWRREVAGAQSDPDLAAWLAEKKDSPEKWARLLKRLQAKPLSLSIWPEGLDAPVQALRPALDAAFAAARGIWQQDRTGAVQTLAEGLPSLRGNSYDQPRLDRSALAWDAWLASGNPLQEDIDKKGKPELFAAGNIEHRKKSKKTPPQH